MKKTNVYQLRFGTDIFPSEVTVVYSPVDDETGSIELSLPTDAQVSIAPAAKAITENSDKKLVIGIAELVLNVLNGNSKISRRWDEPRSYRRTSCDVWRIRRLLLAKRGSSSYSEAGSYSLY